MNKNCIWNSFSLPPPRGEVRWQPALACLSSDFQPNILEIYEQILVELSEILIMGQERDSRGTLTVNLPKIKGQGADHVGLGALRAFQFSQYKHWKKINLGTLIIWLVWEQQHLKIQKQLQFLEGEMRRDPRSRLNPSGGAAVIVAAPAPPHSSFCSQSSREREMEASLPEFASVSLRAVFAKTRVWKGMSCRRLCRDNSVFDCCQSWLHFYPHGPE